MFLMCFLMKAQTDREKTTWQEFYYDSQSVREHTALCQS